MGLIGAPEVAALSFDFQNSTVHGVRLFKHARRGIELVKSAVNHDADIMVAANRVLKDLSVTSSVYLILSVPLEGCCSLRYFRFA